MHKSTAFLIKDNRFISSDMKKYFKHCDLKWSVSSRHFQILFFSQNDLDDKLLCRLKRLFKRINNWLSILRYKIYISIYDYPHHKSIANHITRFSINSGFTFPYSNVIFLYRLDEMEKVCIHEILHHVYKPSTLSCDRYADALNKRFKTAVNLVEAITEFLATLHQLKIISKEYNKNFNSLLNDEIQHSYVLSQKVLSIKNKEITNIFSYIVIKYLLLTRHEIVIKHIKQPCVIAKLLLEIPFNLKALPIKGKENITFMRHGSL